MARDVTNRGGASPPAFTRTTSTSKSPSEAVFIFFYVAVLRLCMTIENLYTSPETPCDVTLLSFFQRFPAISSDFQAKNS